MSKTNEQKAWDYVEAVKLKLKSAILSAKAEKLASDSPFNIHRRAIEALEEFGIEAGLLDEKEVKRERQREKKLLKAAA
jgi:hypothetical protein